MLNRRDISIGKCYVRERTRVAREVIAVMRHRKVVYNAYDLQSGNLLRRPHQICPKNQLLRWADREAKPEEFAKLKRDDALAIFDAEQHTSKKDEMPGDALADYALADVRHLTLNG